jgi:hypothetical protein
MKKLLFLSVFGLFAIFSSLQAADAQTEETLDWTAGGVSIKASVKGTDSKNVRRTSDAIKVAANTATGPGRCARFGSWTWGATCSLARGVGGVGSYLWNTKRSTKVAASTIIAIFMAYQMGYITMDRVPEFMQPSIKALMDSAAKFTTPLTTPLTEAWETIAANIAAQEGSMVGGWCELVAKEYDAFRTRHSAYDTAEAARSDLKELCKQYKTLTCTSVEGLAHAFSFGKLGAENTAQETIASICENLVK